MLYLTSLGKYLEANNYVLICKVGWENWGKVVKKTENSNFRFKKQEAFLCHKLFSILWFNDALINVCCPYVFVYFSPLDIYSRLQTCKDGVAPDRSIVSHSLSIPGL